MRSDGKSIPKMHVAAWAVARRQRGELRLTLPSHELAAEGPLCPRGSWGERG